MASYHVPVTPPEKFEPFVSNSALARLVVIFLAVNMALDVVSIVSTFLQIDLLNKVAGGHDASMEEALANDDRQQLIGVLSLIVYIATVVVFLIWIYRAYRNLKAIGVRKPEYSPGWAVGYFFIPFVNLVRPHQVVQEIWRESDPEYMPDGAPAGQQTFAFVGGSSSAALVTSWWVTWIASNAIWWFVYRMGDPTTVDELRTASSVSIFANVASLVAGILAILVVKKINAMQEEKNRRLSSFIRPAHNPPSGQRL